MSSSAPVSGRANEIQVPHASNDAPASSPTIAPSAGPKSNARHVQATDVGVSSSKPATAARAYPAASFETFYSLDAIKVPGFLGSRSLSGAEKNRISSFTGRHGASLAKLDAEIAKNGGSTPEIDNVRAAVVQLLDTRYPLERVRMGDGKFGSRGLNEAELAVARKITSDGKLSLPQVDAYLAATGDTSTAAQRLRSALEYLPQYELTSKRLGVRFLEWLDKRGA